MLLALEWQSLGVISLLTRRSCSFVVKETLAMTIGVIWGLPLSSCHWPLFMKRAGRSLVPLTPHLRSLVQCKELDTTIDAIERIGTIEWLTFTRALDLEQTGINAPGGRQIVTDGKSATL